MSLYKKVESVKGVIKISVEGFFIERFINLCLQKNIKIWDIERINDGIVHAKMFYMDYNAICEIAKITRCKIEVKEKKGILFLMARYRKRKVFVALILAVMACIAVSNMFVWEVCIDGDFSIPIEEVKAFLAEENIKVGALKKDISTDEAKLNIALKRSDIAWIGINKKGNKIVVEIVPKVMASEDINKNTVGNIISEKAGIVEKIYVAEGTAVVKKGDLIEEGAVLISGLVNGDMGTSRKVRADGEALLKTTYVEKSKIPLEKYVVSKTGNIQRAYKLKIKNYSINLLNKVTKFEKYDTISNEKVFSLFGQIELPIVLLEDKYEEIKVDKISYTKKQAEELGIVSNNEKLKKEIPMEAKQINYYNNIWENEEYIEIETVVQCLEKVGTYEKIEGNVN